VRWLARNLLCRFGFHFICEVVQEFEDDSFKVHCGSCGYYAHVIGTEVVRWDDEYEVIACEKYQLVRSNK
jgi:hypothetical protein